ncbi:MAG: hypothetical protein ACE5DW_05350 [Thermodesulfobacteriota bacterium]
MLTSFSLSGFSWSRFWHPGVTNIGGSNVNYFAPPDTGPITFIAALFIIAAFLFAGLLSFRRKRLSRNTAFKSFVHTFVLIALVAGFRMDYNWAALYRDYSARLAGKDVGARIVELHGNRFYDFMKMIQGDVPEGETIHELNIDVNKNPRRYYMT